MDEERPAAIYRHRLSTRLWHWWNAVVVIVMIMSGLMIFNAHPRLYWGKYGANTDAAWLEILSPGGVRGTLRVGPATVPTTGVLGLSHYSNGQLNRHAFPSWATIPSAYSLSAARRWHLSFAWLLVFGGLFYWVAGLLNRHIARDLLPDRDELKPRHLWQDIKDHARLRLPTGQDALSYNILQKLAYLGVLVVALPLLILTGLAMSPGMDASWPWLLAVTGGRQSARSLHFLCMAAMVAFIVVHLVMVVLAGPINEVRSMLTGWFRPPPDPIAPPVAEPAE